MARRATVNENKWKTGELPDGVTGQTVTDGTGKPVPLDEATHKFCVRCAEEKPLYDFDNHARPSSGHQSECRSCKKRINDVMNPVRTSEQFRESNMYRRLRGLIVKDENLDVEAIFERFDSSCFKCDQDLDIEDPYQYDIDHTLPNTLWWPLTNANATLLCSSRTVEFNGCNSSKHAKWPDEFYDDDQLRELSDLTGIDYDTLNGEPFMCPETLKTFTDDMEGWIQHWRECWEDADDWMEKEFSKIKNYEDIEVPNELWKE